MHTGNIRSVDKMALKLLAVKAIVLMKMSAA